MMYLLICSPAFWVHRVHIWKIGPDQAVQSKHWAGLQTHLNHPESKVLGWWWRWVVTRAWQCQRDRKLHMTPADSLSWCIVSPQLWWVSITFRWDPMHSDNDVTQYMWHSPLHGILTLTHHYLPPSIQFASIWADHTSSAHFHKAHLTYTCLMASALHPAPIIVERRCEMRRKVRQRRF